MFEEAFRVLKPGGRLMISDVVITKDLPQGVLDSVEAYVGCIAGAMQKDEYLKLVKEAGFTEIKIEGETSTPPGLLMSDPVVQSIREQFGLTDDDINEFAGSIVSMKFSAVKPEK